jgi:hypothetical protein
MSVAHEDDELITPTDAFKLLLRNDVLFDEILPRGVHGLHSGATERSSGATLLTGAS